MNGKAEWKPLAWIGAVFLIFYYLPLDSVRMQGAVIKALALTKWYAQEHVILCLVPAFFIAGAIAVFVSQASVMKYLGAKANKFLSYGVVSVSGTILAVCSCTVLPLFAGIYRMGASLLGMLFALSFCPVSAALFFGSLIPLAVNHQSSVTMPIVYGIGTALPVVIFAVLIALGAKWIGTVFNWLSLFEKWARRITALAFILVGIYYSLIYLAGLDI